MNLKRNIKLFYWFNFFVDFRLYAPLAVIYFAQVTGSYALAMSIFAVAKLASAIFEIPTGIFSDFIGRKRTVILGALAATFSVFCYALGFSYWVLLLGAIFEGLAVSFYSGNNEALLYESISDHNRKNEFHDTLGKTSSMFQLALGIAAVLGGFIGQTSLQLVVWLSVLAQLASLVLSFFFIEPKIHSRKGSNLYSHLKEATSEFITNKKLRLLSLSSILSFGIGESAWMFRSAFVALLWPIWAIGIAQTVSNIGATLSYYFAGRLINKFSEIKLLFAGSLYGRITDLIALLFPSVASPAIMTTSSLFFGVGQVATSNLMQKEFTDDQRATMASLNSLAGSLFFAVFSILLGKIADISGPVNALIFANVLSFSTLWIYKKLYS